MGNNPHKYGAGTRLSTAYTMGRNGQPLAPHLGGRGSEAAKAWQRGHDEFVAERAAAVNQRRIAMAKPQTKLHPNGGYARRQKRQQPKMLRIFAKPGSTILGTKYFEETALDVSDSMARHLVETGAASWSATPKQQPNRASIASTVRLIGDEVSFCDDYQIVTLKCAGALHARLIAQALSDGLVSFGSKAE